MGSTSVLGGTGTISAAITVTGTGTLNPGNKAGVAGSAINVGELTVGALALESGYAVFDISSGTMYD